jgi:glutamate N-acetyltransferase / amino-acid N-acetyltransferase
MTTIEPIPDGHLTTPRGFLAGAVSAGIKTVPGALDLALLYSEHDCASAGVFTRNMVKGAPVVLSQKRLAGGRPRAIVVNSGCSNALNGPGGMEDAEEVTRLAASHLGISPDDVLVASTGITGVRLPMTKIRSSIPSVVLTHNGGQAFARAIMTTDTRPKEHAVAVALPVGPKYYLGGCAKGSGMIHPDMATMLAYVTTDAAVAPDFLREVTREVADATFNMVTIDGDTSCSDTFLVFANGASGTALIEAGTPEASCFREALLAVSTHLAREIARDGEGASRLIEVEVVAAKSLEEARMMAKTVALSSLVKTAVAGADPNWGRVLVAAGRSGAEVEEGTARLYLQGELLYDRGRAVPFVESEMRERLEAPEVSIRIDLGLGEAGATAWGCDLTAEYVHINADYTT